MKKTTTAIMAELAGHCVTLDWDRLDKTFPFRRLPFPDGSSGEACLMLSPRGSPIEVRITFMRKVGQEGNMVHMAHPQVRHVPMAGPPRYLRFYAKGTLPYYIYIERIGVT